MSLEPLLDGAPRCCLHAVMTVLLYDCLCRYEWRGWVVLVMLAIIIFFRTAGNIGLLFINFQRR